MPSLRRRVTLPSRAPTALPGDVATDAVRRLRLLSVLAPAAVLLFNVGYNLIILTQRGRWIHEPMDLFGLGLIFVASGVVYVSCTSPRVSARRALDLGLLYEVVVAFVIGVMANQIAWPEGAIMPAFSPVSIVILAFPLIVPGQPRKILLASLAAAAMNPLTLWLMTLLGRPFPEIGQLLARTFPDLIAVAVAWIAAQYLYRLGAEVSRARQLGSYELTTLIGAGGMGEVWRARHSMLAREAAIKLIRPDRLGASEEERDRLVRRFEREAQATASLRCPHTIVVYDFGVADDGTFFYVMELLEGLDLGTLVDQHGPVEPERAVHILRQLCDSLREAHERGFVHRDIKPQNLFLGRLGAARDFVKVLDFGLVTSSPLEGAAASSLTLDGHVAGTPGFMAPEVARGDGEIDACADVYAVGCVAYQLLTGAPVFARETPVAMLLAHLTEPPLSLQERCEVPIPEELEAIVMRCLEKDPAVRYPDAGALWDAVDAIGLADLWTDRDAAAWWDLHHPAGVSVDGTAPTEAAAPGVGP